MEQEGQDRVIAVAATPPQPLDVLYGALMEIFRQDRPTESQLTEVNGAAALALSLVNDGQVPAHGPLCDVAQCSALYGYVLGRQQGKQLANAR
jgi:hypothetical protein